MDVWRKIEFKHRSWFGSDIGEFEGREWVREDVETDVSDELEGVGRVCRRDGEWYSQRRDCAVDILIRYLASDSSRSVISDILD